MEDENVSFKYVSDKDIKKTNFSNNSSGGEIYLSRERQEQIKKLMFSALEDPRKKYKTVTLDEVTEKWIDEKEVRQRTIDSN